MRDYLKKTIVSRLADSVKPLNDNDFKDLTDDENLLFDVLAELKDRGFIDAKFLFSNRRESCGIIKASNISITPGGRDFIEDKPQQPPPEVKPTYNINISGSFRDIDASTKVAGHDISNYQEPDWEKLHHLILSQIEKSPVLKGPDKKGLFAKFKAIFTGEVAPIIARIIVEAVKQFIRP